MNELKDLIEQAIEQAIEMAKDQFPESEIAVTIEGDNFAADAEFEIDLPDPKELVGDTFMGDRELLKEWDKPFHIECLRMDVYGLEHYTDKLIQEDNYVS